MTNPDEVEHVDSFINALAALPAEEQATKLLDFVADGTWQAAPAAEPEGRAR